MELVRRFATSAPAFRSFSQDKPTLLVSWWCTLYAVTIILFRVCGRYIRTEKIFLEDGIMFVAVIPLLIRMAFVHVVLLYGTNNTITTSLTAVEVKHREIGSQLVLASRIMYTAYLWTIKYSLSIYLKTITESVWKHSHQKMLRYLHIFLAISFIGAVVADLAACQPFSHYWQVIPDPGSQCRQGYAHLLTNGVLNIITNVALVVFAIPMILKARISRIRKISIIIRMALPLFGIALTIYQLPSVISRLGEQQFRSLVASFDILVATITSNAAVLGSLLQDRGYKKTKYNTNYDYNTKKTTISTANAMHNSWDSDEDLMRTSSTGGKGSVMIGLDDFPSPGSGSKKPPHMPTPAKFPAIRVANSWGVQVDKRKTGE